jgi:hypothetical protein
MLRIFRAPRAHFVRDAELADEAHPDDALHQIAGLGFNGIWIRMVARRLLKNPAYPAFGDQAEQCLPGLRRVIERAARRGLKVYAYLQEPLGMPSHDPFWKEHPALAGATYQHQDPFTYASTPMTAFCTSTEAGREFLVESSEGLLRQLPGLGGILTITASEFIAHCYSKYHFKAGSLGSHHGDRHPEPLRCSRCRERHPSDVVAEILNLMRTGMNRANRETPLLAWNWGWTAYEPDPQERILSQLQEGIEVLADFERGGTRVEPDGRRIAIDEYALSYAGPSERFLKMKAACDARGFRTHAKLQIGTTHEIATVSNLPLIGHLFEKARAFRKLKLDGFLGCWNFGLSPSLNLRAFNFFLSDDCPERRKDALSELAKREFAGGEVAVVLEAWAKFDAAFEHYPFSVPFLYFSPINYALALPFEAGPLDGKPMGRSWVLDERGSDLAQSCRPFSAEEIVERLTRLLERWNEGLAAYDRALKGVHPELDAARAAAVSVRSARNFYRLYLLKRNWSEAWLPQYREIVREEIATLDEAIPVYERDPRQGFHQECAGRMVTVEALRKKRERLRTVQGRE